MRDGDRHSRTKRVEMCSWLRCLRTPWVFLISISVDIPPNARLGLEMRIEPGLIERRLGSWNGRSIEETQPLLAAGRTPPGGESSVRFTARVLTAFRSLAPLYARWPPIVSSRGVARVLMENAGSRGCRRGAELHDPASHPRGFGRRRRFRGRRDRPSRNRSRPRLIPLRLYSAGRAFPPEGTLPAPGSGHDSREDGHAEVAAAHHRRG